MQFLRPATPRFEWFPDNDFVQHHLDDRKIEKLFMEPGFKDNPPGVPLGVSGAEVMLDFLQAS